MPSNSAHEEKKKRRGSHLTCPVDFVFPFHFFNRWAAVCNFRSMKILTATNTTGAMAILCSELAKWMHESMVQS